MSASTTTAIATEKKATLNPIFIIGALFFIFGFVTWLNSVLIPYLKLACQLSDFESYLVATAFYVAYFVMAIPSSWLLKVFGFKKGMSVGLFVMAIGAALFIPAALSRTYGLFLLGLFVQGSGLALLQTASNPYVTIIGPLESAAKRISIMGICNKVAGAIAPVILGAITLKNADELKKKLLTMDTVQKSAELNELASRVILPYIIIISVLVVLAALIYFSSLPEVESEQEDDVVTSKTTSKSSIFQFPHLILGAVTIFVYVGVEVMAGDSIISYGASQGIALSTAKFFTTCTLGAMIVGYLIGIIGIPKFFSQEKALKVSAILGVVFTLVAMFTHGYVSVLFIALLGLANALMWPAIWPLAIAGLGRFTKIGSSLLIMGIVGGAIIPPLYGFLVSKMPSNLAYFIMLPCYIFILYYAAVGHKIRRA
jgi:glucose/galactose transporter